MNIKNRFLLLLLVLTLVITPLCSCDAILNVYLETSLQESSSVTETNLPEVTTPEATTPEETTSSQTTLEETSLEETTPEITTPEETEDYKTKYANMTPEEFYADYELAENAEDAYWRSYYGFMSGSLTTPDQAPTVAENRPMQDGMYIRNSVTTFIGDDVYVLVDVNGDVVMEIYRGGAYITLEEVAAYVYAFGDIPANYTSKKKRKTLQRQMGRVSPFESLGLHGRYP